MAAPVKQGVQGGDSMENEAEGPKFDLWLPRCLFGFFLGIQKEARRRSGEIPSPGAQAPTSATEKLVSHDAKGAPSKGGTTMLGNLPRQRQR